VLRFKRIDKLVDLSLPFPAVDLPQSGCGRTTAAAYDSVWLRAARERIKGPSRVPTAWRTSWSYSERPQAGPGSPVARMRRLPCPWRGRPMDHGLQGVTLGCHQRCESSSPSRGQEGHCAVFLLAAARAPSPCIGRCADCGLHELGLRHCQAFSTSCRAAANVAGSSARIKARAVEAPPPGPFAICSCEGVNSNNKAESVPSSLLEGQALENLVLALG